MNSSMKISDVNMETEALANHINILPMHSSMKATDVNMEIEALANHIRLTRRGEGGSVDVGNKKKTKKKVFCVPQEELDDILSFQLPPTWASLAKRCPSLVGELEKMKDSFLAEREKMRLQYRIMGYATFEAEVPDEEEEQDTSVAIPVATSFHGEKDDATATSFHGHKDDAAVTSFHGEKDDATATSFHWEKDDATATSFHGEKDDATATSFHGKKDDVTATSFHGEKDDAAATSSPWIIPRGRGRRRFRPGVVKQASGVKKIT
ncbi:hypothetical protein CFC21_073841 [Triticum aestivum]|uniref:Uncharacterized protein n=2 Tax=Triticum aestivum TaxID=4565 RepID=A0A9R1KVN0_WHEAT|nr:hypothetical protein CFC21_073841 [Triticum aestivum]